MIASAGHAPAPAHAAGRRLAHRNNLLWLAALLHRLSGIALATFLPLHVLALGLALDGEARLDQFLRWSEAPPVRLGEGVLVFLFAAHALGGMRLLVLENSGRTHGQRAIAAAGAAVAAALAIGFLAVLFAS